MAIVTVPKPLREKLGEQGAEALVTLINQANGQLKEDVIEVVAERFERRLSEEIGKLRSEMHDEIGKLRSEMHNEIGKLRSEMHNEIGKLRSEMHDEMGKLRAEMHDEMGKLRGEMGGLRGEMGQMEGRIVRWSFLFWVGQVATIVAILFAFFK